MCYLEKCLSVPHIVGIGIDKRHALLPVRVGLGKARDVCVKDEVKGVGVVIYRPLGFCAVPVE